MKINLTILTLLCAAASVAFAKDKTGKVSDWKETLQPVKEEILSSGRNDYFVLEPGYKMILEGKEDGEATRLEITVLNDTKKVDNVETRIVEERESQNGKLIELSRNYFAIGKDSKNLYYFGEEVDVYKGDKVVHEGSWEAGRDGAQFGIMVPGRIKKGDRYYQERAPKVAMDRAENVSLKDVSNTPAGTFKDCLKTRETTPLEPGVEFKVYAPGVGIVEDGPLKLVKYGKTN